MQTSPTQMSPPMHGMLALHGQPSAPAGHMRSLASEPPTVVEPVSP